jgi:hypothetical protein
MFDADPDCTINFVPRYAGKAPMAKSVNIPAHTRNRLAAPMKLKQLKCELMRIRCLEPDQRVD